MKIVDRYVLGELVGPGLFGLALFSTLWLAQVLIRMIDLLVTKGVDLAVVGKIFLYSIPWVFTTSAPMAALLASLMAVGRLSADSELTSMRAAGLSPLRVIAPVVVAGWAFSLGVLATNELIVPESNLRRTRVYLNEVVLKKPLPKVAQNIFFEGGKQFKMFVRGFKAEESRMYDITIFSFESGQFPRVSEARSALLLPRRWLFADGTMDTYRPDGSLESIVRFKTWDYPLDLRYAERVDDVSPRVSDMSLLGMLRAIRDAEAKGQPTTVHWVDFWFKTAFPFASMFLMLIGAPLAVGSARSGTSIGIGLSTVIMFLYYVLIAMGRAAGEAGTLTPFWAGWGPNIVALAVGAFLLRRIL